MKSREARLCRGSFCPIPSVVRASCRLALISLAVTVLASPWAPEGTPQAKASDPELLPLLGTYRFAGGQEETQEVERAIDEAVEEMNVFIRGIARRRLQEPNLPTDELRISLGGDMITVARTGQPKVSAPATGKRVAWRNPRNGNELEVSHRITPAGALEQKLVGDRGTSTNVFTISADGKLSMKTTVTADKLPSAIRFTTTYVRK